MPTEKSIQLLNKKIKQRWTREESDLHAAARHMGSDTGIMRPLFIVFIGWMALFASSLPAQEYAIVRSQASQTERASLPPYIQRGNEVSARFQAFTQDLGKFHHDLQARLMTEEPDLAELLKDEPPQALVYGYQVLPPLVADEPIPEKPDRATSTSYSWVRTSRQLDREYARLKTGRAAFRKLSLHSIAEQRPHYEQLVVDYRLLADNQGLIEEHIQHNRFWQKRVAEDKSRFDRLTTLHDAVLEWQAIRDSLATETEAGTIRRMQYREQELTAMIDADRDRKSVV